MTVPMVAASAIGATLLLCGGAGSYHIIDHLLTPSSAVEATEGSDESPVPSDGGGTKPTVQASDADGKEPQASDGGGEQPTVKPTPESTNESHSANGATSDVAPSEDSPGKNPSPVPGETSNEQAAHDEGSDEKSDAPLKPSASDKIIIVTDTDTLSGISEREGVSVQHLAEINHIENVDLIYTGQSLRIPQFE